MTGARLFIKDNNTYQWRYKDGNSFPNGWGIWHPWYEAELRNLKQITFKHYSTLCNRQNS